MNNLDMQKLNDSLTVMFKYYKTGNNHSGKDYMKLYSEDTLEFYVSLAIANHMRENIKYDFQKHICFNVDSFDLTDDYKFNCVTYELENKNSFNYISLNNEIISALRMIHNFDGAIGVKEKYAKNVFTIEIESFAQYFGEMIIESNLREDFINNEWEMEDHE